MEYIAIAKNIKISPRKVRLVADGVKEKKLMVALSSLSVMNKRAAGPIKKALDSAVANATNNFQAKKDELTIKDIIVDGGVGMKRFHFAGRGRTRPYKRRTSHIRVILADGKTRDTMRAVAPVETAEEAKPKGLTAGIKAAAKRVRKEKSE
ncbi:MAG TPA: 50S ribosomal protein L22 [Patescibacteria group bacterium]|nr:50S ribosomal protein L22 [Patescibacteria group bacterium]